MYLNRYSLERLGDYAVRFTSNREQKDHAKEELETIVGRSQETIFSATTVFPFTLFPDTVTIDRTKLSITHRVFFFVGEVISIKIEDILNVTASVGPFFGAVQIHTRFFDPHKPYTVNFLWRKDALRIDRIMQGYSIALDEKIDCGALETKELARMLDRLGRTTASSKI